MTIAEIAKPSNTAKSTPAWVEELESWKSISAHSQVWDDIDTFVDAIRALAMTKIMEREAGRNALRAVLEGLTSQFAQELDYFEARVSCWVPERVATFEAEQVASRVTDLHMQLEERKTLQGRPAAHYAEARRLREEINAAEDTIFSQIAAIDECFASGSGGAAALEEIAEAVAPVEPPKKPSGSSNGPARVTLPPLEMVEDLDTVEQIGAPAPAVAVVKDEPAPEVVAPALSDDEIAGSLHMPLPAHGWWSPLTRAQESSIVGPGASVGLVFASGALGFEHLPEAVSRLASSVNGVYSPVPPSISSADDIANWIGKFVDGHKGAELLVAAQPVVVSAPNIRHRVEGALKYCKEHPKVPVRFLFFLAPGAVAAWLDLPAKDRAAIEEKLIPIIHLEPWTPDAVQDRFERLGKLYDEDTVAHAMRATGGWSWCLDKLMEQCGDATDPRAAVEQVSERLREGDLRDEFLMRIGIRAETLPDRVLKLVMSEGEVPIDLIDPEVVGTNESLEECRTAVRYLETMSCATQSGGTVRLNPFLGSVLSAA